MLVLGDAHAHDPARRRLLERIYAESDADVALQVGDLGTYDLPVETYFVAGNNEDHDVIEALRRDEDPPSSVRNAHLLASDVVEVQGLRVAGLSGNFAPTKFETAREDLEADRRRHFVADDVEAAKALDDVDVFLAHEAPHGLLEQGGYDVGCTHVDDILETLEPALCLVGHHETAAESRFGTTRVLSLAPIWEAYYELYPDTLWLTRHDSPDVPDVDG